MRRWLRASFLFAGVTALAAVAFAGPAVGGPTPVTNTLTISKTVEGPVPAGTTFTVSVDCDNNVIQGDGGATNTATVEFAADGQPTSPDVIDLRETLGSCTVTETENGGASSTTFACVGVATASPAATAVAPICPEAGPVPDDIVVNKSYPAIEATVTVHNKFDPAPTTTTTPPSGPQPAAQVVAKPAFTG